MIQNPIKKEDLNSIIKIINVDSGINDSHYVDRYKIKVFY